MPKIECKNVTVTYFNKKNKDEVKGLSSFSATFPSDKFSCVIGYSGAGKSTLLRSIAGLEKYEGEILYNGLEASNIEIQKRNISYVSQNYVLYPHLTVFENIAYPLRSMHCKRDEIISRVYEISSSFNLTPFLFRKPSQLSGGQQQRVALVRALVKKPLICLFDEPFSNLDLESRREERRFVKKAMTSFLTTSIFVTHNIEDALSLADKIYVINNGKLEEEGDPLTIYNSSNEIVRSLIKAGEE